MCQFCGHIGCCDSSPNRHETAHFRGTGWSYGYADEVTFVLEPSSPIAGTLMGQTIGFVALTAGVLRARRLPGPRLRRRVGLLRRLAGPRSVWLAGAATVLFVAGIGAAGNATRRDLSGLGRRPFWALHILDMLRLLLSEERVRSALH